MTLAIIHHKVRDFAEWKSAFDDHASTQTAAGMTNSRVYRSADNPNEVTILFDVADIARAKEFAGSAELKSAMEGAGVVVAPSFHYLEGPASQSRRAGSASPRGA